MLKSNTFVLQMCFLFTFVIQLINQNIMEAKKYRIGNYVQYNNENKSIGRITALVSDFVSGLDYCQIDHVINKKHWLINVNPLPLTEEWLLKFGFEIKDDNPKQKSHYEGDILFKIKRFEFSNSMIEGFCCYELDLTIKYIHQLQNLYFALTGEELTFK